MKYKLINRQTNKETICAKVTIDAFDYYMSDEGVVNPCYFYNKPTNYLGKALRREGNFWVCENIEGFHLLSEAKKVIATNNPNIDIPKVVDEVERLFTNISKNPPYTEIINKNAVQGYNKSQETHPFSEEDMVEFSEWKINKGYYKDDKTFVYYGTKPFSLITTKELLQLFKEQQLKTLYYEHTSKF